MLPRSVPGGELPQVAELLGAFAGAILLVALATKNLDGFERYALSGFPLVLGAANASSSERVERCRSRGRRGGVGRVQGARFHDLYVP